MTVPLSRRAFLRLSATGSAAGIVGLAGHAQDPTPPAPTPNRSRTGAEFITQKTEEAIREGHEFLAPVRSPTVPSPRRPK